MIDTDKYEGHTPAPWGRDYDLVFEYSGENIANLVLGNEANEQLITDAPLILQALIDERAEVERLRGQLRQARECLSGCYDLKRFGNEMKDEDWDFIGRLLGADTDHNDNEWSEDE